MFGRKDTKRANKATHKGFLTSVIALIVVAVASSVWAGDFLIGVWYPAGADTYDVSFTSTDVENLADLGVNFLAGSPKLDYSSPADISQNIEETTMALLPDSIKYIVTSAPEGNGPPFSGQYYYYSLDHYAKHSQALDLTQRGHLGTKIDTLY